MVAGSFFISLINKQMKKFEYIEVDMNVQIPFIDILNDYGNRGYEFVTQAQRMEKTVDFKTGRPKVTLVIIFKKLIDVQPKAIN
jgi:hypothetical protein